MEGTGGLFPFDSRVDFTKEYTSDGVLELQWGNSRQHDQGFLAIPLLSELKV
jgi:hypothetical protein